MLQLHQFYKNWVARWDQKNRITALTAFPQHGGWFCVTPDWLWQSLVKH